LVVVVVAVMTLPAVDLELQAEVAVVVDTAQARVQPEFMVKDSQVVLAPPEIGKVVVVVVQAALGSTVHQHH
jgi:hypothetical protein